jgi:hypothetical protein
LETIIGAIVSVRTTIVVVILFFCISSESVITGNRGDIQRYYGHSMLSLLWKSPPLPLY